VALSQFLLHNETAQLHAMQLNTICNGLETQANVSFLVVTDLAYAASAPISDEFKRFKRAKLEAEASGIFSQQVRTKTDSIFSRTGKYRRRCMTKCMGMQLPLVRHRCLDARRPVTAASISWAVSM